ncbi:MAG: paraslipin [Spirochaetota bacterium]|nr:paraslipin [Spirochaetota bacterium]
MWLVLAIILLVFLFIVWKMFVIVPTRENCIKERLGKFVGILNPGFHFLIPFIDRIAYRHEMREQVLDIPVQTCITRDNIQVDVDGLVYLKVMDAYKASYGIADYHRASINMAQTTMRSEIGKMSLDNTFSERESINENIVKEIDKASDPWGIKMLRYEIKNITPSKKIIDTMEKQMEAERQKRAEILLAQADKEARINLSQGERQEAINISEGEKSKRINEADGRASEISLLADASANGIRLVAEAIKKQGGPEAVKMQIIEQFIDEFGKILRKSNISVVPAQLANIKGFFEGIGKLSDTLSDHKITDKKER